MFENTEGREILISEVIREPDMMKRNKADWFATEMLPALDYFDTDKITEVINGIYNSGNKLEDLSKSILVTLSKTPGTIECELHRTNRLMSHITKLIMRILMYTARSSIRPERGQE